MAFKVSVLYFESCDKCGVKATDEAPILEIYASGKGDKSMIFVHERCLAKTIENTKKREEKLKSQGAARPLLTQVKEKEEKCIAQTILKNL